MRRASEQSGVVYSLTKTLAGYYVVQFRLFITKGKAERRGVFRPKGRFASFRGGSTEVRVRDFVPLVVAVLTKPALEHQSEK